MSVVTLALTVCLHDSRYSEWCATVRCCMALLGGVYMGVYVCVCLGACGYAPGLSREGPLPIRRSQLALTGDVAQYTLCTFSVTLIDIWYYLVLNLGFGISFFSGCVICL